MQPTALVTKLVTTSRFSPKENKSSLMISTHGRVAEWFKAPVLKTGRGFCSLVGSNPTPSATTLFYQYISEQFPGRL
jgi:hypothetical protein